MKFRKSIRSLLALSLATTLLGTVLATSEGDSLISQSFVDYVYKTWIRENMVAQVSLVIDPFYEEKMAELEALRQQNTTQNMEVAHNLELFLLSYGTEVSLPQGSVILPMTGELSLDKIGTVINLTTGKEQDSGKLQLGNQYLVVENSTGLVRSLSDTAQIGVQGVYTLQEVEITDYFLDVSTTDWFYEAVHYVKGRTLFAGTSDEYFSPYDTTNRAMMTTVLYRLANSPQSEMDTAIGSFLDVNQGDWFESYVRWGSSQKLAVGVGDGYFLPMDNVTRQQVIVMLYAFASQYLGLDMSNGAALSPFEDGSEVASWASVQMTWAVAKGLFSTIPDSTQQLKPTQVATRAEVATMLMNFNQYVIQ